MGMGMGIGIEALRGINLEIPAGRIGLLGANGAGKSTLLKVMLGLVKITSGTIDVLGHDPQLNPRDLRAEVGYMPEGDAVPGDHTALEYVVLAAELCGLDRGEAVARAHQTLQYVGLGETRYRPLATFSTGLRQRARLAQALVGDPKLLLLDEPTSGLDPEGRDDMLKLIADIPTKTGANVMLSTHILHDVERVCQSVVVLAEGQVEYAGPLGELLAAEGDQFEIRVAKGVRAFEDGLAEAGCLLKGRGESIRVSLPEDAGPELVLKIAYASGARVKHLAPLKRSLEQALLSASNVPRTNRPIQ